MISANSPTCMVGMANSQASMTLATEKNEKNQSLNSFFFVLFDYSLLIEKWILNFYHVKNQTFHWYQVNKHHNELLKKLEYCILLLFTLSRLLLTKLVGSGRLPKPAFIILFVTPPSGVRFIF